MHEPGTLAVFPQHPSLLSGEVVGGVEAVGEHLVERLEPDVKRYQTQQTELYKENGVAAVSVVSYKPIKEGVSKADAEAAKSSSPRQRTLATLLLSA